MTPLYLLAEIFPAQDKLEEAKQVFEELIAKTLLEPGCLLYDLVIEEGKDHWIMVEKWESEEAWKAHMNTDHVRQNQIDTHRIAAKQTHLRFLTPVSV